MTTRERYDAAVKHEWELKIDPIQKADPKEWAVAVFQRATIEQLQRAFQRAYTKDFLRGKR